jgi:Tol biopolymer transport system component
MGDAIFYGSTGNLTLNSPVKSLVPDPDGVGYWLIAGDGGVFSFDATFRGSMGSTPLNGPVVGMVSFGNGYLQVGSDGGIFNFSNLNFFGSLGGNPPAIPIVSVAAFSSTAMTISTSSLAAATQGVAYSATVATADSTGAVTWSATGLPTGMSISPSTGVISGKPSCLSGTTASVTVNATDSNGTASRTLSLAVNALPYKGDFTSGESTAEIKRITNDTPVGINYLSRATLSANGCMLAFEDRSATLANSSTVLGALPDTNAGDDIFVLDRGSGIVRRITSGNQFSAMPTLSADGRFLAFNSHATNLSGTSDGVFYVDLVTNAVTRVSPGHAGDGTRAGSEVQISADGSHVVYSVSGNTAPNFYSQVYLWRKSDGLTTQVTHAPTIVSSSYPDANGESYNPTVNTDGTVVAFTSTATNLDGATDTNTASDIFVWNGNGAGYRSHASGNPGPTGTATGTIFRVTNGDASSNWPYMSADGSRIAFVTYATDIDGTTRGPDADTTPAGFDGADFPQSTAPNSCGAGRTCDEVFTQDADVAYATRPGSAWASGATLTRVTNGANGSFLVGVSNDGGVIVFDSHDGTPAATTGGEVVTSLTIFSKATASAATAPVALVPYNTGDAFNDEQKARPAISGDGRYVVFQSNDANPATNGQTGESDNNSSNGPNLDRMDFFLLSRSAT